MRLSRWVGAVFSVVVSAWALVAGFDGDALAREGEDAGLALPDKPNDGGLGALKPAYADVPIPDRTPAEWQEVTRKNLFAMREMLIESSPIVLPGGDERQAAWLDQGYQEALALIPRVHDELGLLYVLRRYALGFDDIHLDVRQAGPSLVTLWPGFVAGREGSETVVTWRRAEPLAGQPPVGARILSCDGKTIEALIEEGLFTYWRARGFSRGYLQATARLFIDNGNSFFRPPTQCVMQWDGAEHTVTLHWRSVGWGDPDFSAAYLAADGAHSAEWGLSTPAPGVTWVGVPSFLDQTTDALPAPLVDVIDDLNVNRGRYQRGRAIVVDLRGNRGGLLGGASDLAGALFGENAVRRSRALSTRAGWMVRISPENVSHLMSIAEAAQEGPRPEGSAVGSSSSSRWLYLGALRNNQPSLMMGPSAARSGGLTALREGAPPADAPYRARVFILVNETCLSACLWFLDVASFMPGVQIIGGVSGTDGALTGPRIASLPEPGMTLLLPMIEPRGAARGAGEAYTPDIAYSGLWEDSAVRAWVLGLVDEAIPPTEVFPSTAP